MIRKVYLAGPMTGKRHFNIEEFDAAAQDLRDRGLEVISPAEIDGPVTREQLLKSETGDHADLPADETWSYYLARDFRILHDEKPDAIVCLPGWEQSQGAGWEVYIGKRLGIPQYDYDPVYTYGFRVPTSGPALNMCTEPGMWACTHAHCPPMTDVERASYDRAMERQPDFASDDSLYDAAGKFITHEDNPLRQRAVTGAVKDNRGKSRVELLPSEPLIAVGRVLAFGAAKYKPNNWRLGLSWLQTIGSALRHIFAFMGGEDIDPESGECHVDNAITQLMFLSTYYHTKTGEDDRWSSLASAAKEEAKA